mmetsp:Transcript_15000/g.22895  ORF Transcript_15000/g.22895 Transcript_15000/m.22895 type:complete len:189 (-) Transcript_15000:220-786(-)|eukprot:CAMPEP_0178917052 /NCGR_PEP_ID=MMETSP0786-20121207/13021_1 /TAXON_ID=186022 /ORGANISM="Thalassionema frauenfeldii, Strain CCMP 1798" /LENGTH=188 /DNA_ID=CAMNT_0020590537 /DNA_START=17 /DNA_END=583 /DNA_ORIENTATION=-
MKYNNTSPAWTLPSLLLLLLSPVKADVFSATCKCYQGTFEIKGEWTPYGDQAQLKFDSSMQDQGQCGFIKVCDGTVLQLVMGGETSYFAIDSACSATSPCGTVAKSEHVCAIDEFEILTDAAKVPALVHGGNAEITVGLTGVEGQFIAGPSEQDPHPDRPLFYSSAEFTIKNLSSVECPVSGRGCDTA